MRVFVTGATGFIGSAVVQELRGAGHQVLGLARNDAAADALARLDVESHRGDLSDPASLAAGARACDGVIHTAFIHDFANIVASGVADLHAIEAFGAALEGSGKPLVVTSAVGHLAHGRVSTEDDLPDPGAAAKHRVASEAATLALAARGVRASLLRLPPSVHGEGDHGFVPRLIDIAREKGVSAYPGDGSNRWAAVHRFDAAHLFRLALEASPVGARLHAIGDGGVPVREIAGAIGRHLGLPVTAISPETAADHFGWLGAFFSLDVPASSTLTRELLDWRPTRAGLLDDLEQGHYFHDRAA